eukprot:c52651_g1_i1.p1 GENE.c52651_g1_i1~~c52651_g1_i1.p1  ORF type:complete len:313 (+),score=81.66 c52651_g1_i1:38-940(+)
MSRLVVSLLFLGLASAHDFAKYKDCWSCTGDGWGWCPLARKCGGFANKNCGEKSDERYYREDAVPKVKSKCVVLTDKNFDDFVDGSKHALVEFYAPWCGHCKSLKPIYEKVCENFQGESNVVVGILDATANQAVGQRFSITGFPTIKFFPKGADVDDGSEEYNSGRDEDSFVSFLNSKTGSKRVAGGGLLPDAGRDGQLDAIVSAFVASDGTGRESVLADARKRAEQVELGSFYVKTMERIISQGTASVAEQLERIQKMLSTDSVKPAKRSEFQKKINVLNVFGLAIGGAGASSGGRSEL